MDVNTAFLNGVIEEEVYIEKPQGFEVYGRESHVCRLKKALYSLKQAATMGALFSFFSLNIHAQWCVYAIIPQIINF